MNLCALTATGSEPKNERLDQDRNKYMKFEPFPKIPRLNRTITIQEKIDGTNACVYVDDNGGVHAGSRTRWITPEDDNYGFAAWVAEREDELHSLGPGYHFGEWWGRGINRNYGVPDRRFSLFNVAKWRTTAEADPRLPKAELAPACCLVVPVLYVGPFHTYRVEAMIDMLRENGSVAVPGFMRPEGVVVFHQASGQLFKVTVENDAQPKGAAVA